MLKQNPNFNTSLPESSTNQRYIFGEPTVINPQTGQIGGITPESLTPTLPLKVETPTPTPIPSIANLPPPPTPPPPTEATTWTSQLEELQSQILGAPTAKVGKVSGATAGYQKQLDELNAQIRMQQVTALERQEKALATGETLGFAAGEATRVARTDAIETMKLSSLAQAMQGNISTATKLAESAVDAEYAEKLQKLATTRNNIIKNWDSFTEAEKKRAEITLTNIDAQDTWVKEKKQESLDIQKVARDAAQAGGDNVLLNKILKAPSVIEADRLLAESGLLFEYKARQAAAGRAPGEPDAKKPLTLWEISEFERRYDWTPPYGFTQSQLNQFIKDNPGASPAELEKGAKQALAQTQGITMPTTEKNTIEGVKERIKTAKDGGYNDDEIKTAIKKIYTTDELFVLAKSAGYAKWYTGKGSDVERMLDAILTQ